MIRILHVVTYMGRGGLETAIMNYYRNIDRSKIQFDFLTHREFRADYDDEIESLGGKIFRIPRLIPWSKTYNQALSSFLKEHPEYKIVHVHQDCMSSLICKAAKENGVPVRIAHSHSSSQDKDLKYVLKLHYRNLITKYATDLFACGEKAGKWMFKGAPFELMNNAIAADKYVYSDERASIMKTSLNIPNDSFVVGHIGRFAKAKNHAFLLDIFFEIKKQKKNAVLLLVGDGELRNNIISKAKELGILENIIFTGIRNDVHDLLQAMNVFIMPSIYEGLPVSLVEAQASGIPCIICDHFSKDCDITDLINRISLNGSPKEWADLAISLEGMPRRNTFEEIKNAKFDIVQNAEWLQNYYFDRWKAIE